MLKRRRFKQTLSLKDGLLHFAHETREKAEALPPRPARDQLLKKESQAETAAEKDGWIAPKDALLTFGERETPDPASPA